MSQPPKLLDQVRELLRIKHYALRTEEAYVDWTRNLNVCLPYSPNLRYSKYWPILPARTY
jgi:hypothetical protein